MKAIILGLALFSCTASGGQKDEEPDIAPSGPTGLQYPENWQALAPWDDVHVSTVLPKSFNWNDYGKLQPIRNQKSCGSCWAFSVAGVTESLHRLVYPMLFPVVDLAEQTLVSTCENGGDCGGGFFTAFNYVRDNGLPFESADPYLARNSACKSGLVPAVKITRWSYVGESNRGPTTEQIKQSVYDHGPVSVDINGSLASTTNVITSCGSTFTNHMVNIEGWVDSEEYAQYGGGYWIVRNSWGTGWGDGGYFKIVYKSRSGSRCNGIGGTTAYAVINEIENIREHLGIE